MVIDATLATFNQADFRSKAAAVIGVAAENVVIFGVTPASLIVNFGFVNIPIAQIQAATQTFVENVRNNQQFTNAFPVLSVVTVTFTPAPMSPGFNWRQIEASSALAIPTLLLAAVTLIASFTH